MTEIVAHPALKHLEELVEGSLPRSEAVRVHAHLDVCAHCKVEVSELRMLFAELASLSYVEPRPGFASRVMARVRVRRPFRQRVAAALDRFMPTTAREWIIAGSATAPATLAWIGILSWLFSRPWWNTRAIASYAWQVLYSFAATRMAGVWTDVSAWAGRSKLIAGIRPLLAAPEWLVLACLAVFIPFTLFLWGFQTLLHPSSPQNHHASHST